MPDLEFGIYSLAQSGHLQAVSECEAVIKVSLRERFHTYTRASLSVFGTKGVPCSANQVQFVTARSSLACATSMSHSSAEAQ